MPRRLRGDVGDEEALGFPQQGFWKSWVSRDLNKKSPGCENPGLAIPKHKFVRERKAHFHDSESPCLQNPCEGNTYWRQRAAQQTDVRIDKVHRDSFRGPLVRGPPHHKPTFTYLALSCKMFIHIG